MENQWVTCPLCRSKTRVMLRPDTVLRNFPLYCPKCHRETVIDAQNGRIVGARIPA